MSVDAGDVVLGDAATMGQMARSDGSSFRPVSSPSDVRRAAQHSPPGRRPSGRPFRPFLVCFLAAFIGVFSLIWVYVAVFPRAYLSRFHPLWEAKQAMLAACEPTSIAVFGDSRLLAGIDPRQFSMSVQNFAVGASTPIETYFVVRRALRCPNNPKLAIIGHVPGQMIGDIDGWHRGARDHVLSYAELREIAQDATALDDNSTISDSLTNGLPQSVRAWLYGARFPTVYFSSLVHGLVAGRLRMNNTVYDQALKTRGYFLVGTAAGSSDRSVEAMMTDFKVPPLIDQYLSRTLALLAERHIPVLFLNMPLNQATYSRVQPALREQFTTYLRTVAKNFDNVVISDPVFPCWSDTYYGDEAHFNTTGAELFSRALDPILQQLLNGASTASVPDRCTEQSLLSQAARAS